MIRQLTAEGNDVVLVLLSCPNILCIIIQFYECKSVNYIERVCIVVHVVLAMKSECRCEYELVLVC